MTGKGLHLPTQNERIMEYLRSHPYITTYEAMVELGIARLASRISDLKRKGVKFDKKFIDAKNRYGECTRYLAYSLREEK